MIKVMIAVSGIISLAAAPSLPTPPLPPEFSPYDTAAPVPRTDGQTPQDIAVNSQIQLRTFNQQSYEQNVSGGYLPGSQYENKEDRKAIQTPGLSLTIPFK
jgi:hypothetical protein